MIDATHLSEIINQPLKPGSQPFLKDGFSMFELGNPSPQVFEVLAKALLKFHKPKIKIEEISSGSPSNNSGEP
jgi:hypothetical protein